ncbi:MAG: non-heme iron oxygenase ferredoxin subunit [Rhodanobacteraceae bacterium]|nr:non-heme iron oxygenase ferredoxin subunit [Rhodanobacteraceae bacterium]
MDGWTRVCGRDEMAPGEHRVVAADGTMIAVFNIDGDHYAIEDVCTHDGGELAGGPIHGFEVECPRHGARFDVRNGAVCAPPAYAPTASFPVRIDADGVWTRDDRWD